LIAALDQVGPEFRVGVINALGKRRGPDVVAALHQQAADPNPEVRLAAVEALANAPEASNDDPIAAAGRTDSPRGKSRANKARIRLAETLRNAGNKPAAIAIYRSVASSDADAPQKKAAQRALDQLT
jgi:HEAT repeat protein